MAPGWFRRGRPKSSSDAAARVDFGLVLSLGSWRAFFAVARLMDKASPLGRALQTAIIAYGPLVEKARDTFRKRPCFYNHTGQAGLGRNELHPQSESAVGSRGAGPLSFRLVLAPNCKDGSFGLRKAELRAVPRCCRRKSRTSVAWIQSARSWVRRCRAPVLPLLLAPTSRHGGHSAVKPRGALVSEAASGRVHKDISRKSPARLLWGPLVLKGPKDSCGELMFWPAAD